MKILPLLIIFSLLISMMIGCSSVTSTPHPPIEDTFTPIPSPTSELIVTVTFTPPSAVPATGQHSFRSEKAGRNYLLFLPESYGKDTQKKWPLILFLHGSGTRNQDVNFIKYEALPQILEFTPDFPAIVLSPQLTDDPSEDFWTREKVEQSVFTLLDEIQSAYSVDPKRIYLTGVSLGANGVWEYGLKYPKRFAALAPVMGFIGDTTGFRTPNNICDLKDVPIWAFHGALDPIVPLAAEQSLVNALKACNSNIQFTIYPDGDHDISGRVYNNNPDFLNWLLSQSLK